MSSSTSSSEFRWSPIVLGLVLGLLAGGGLVWLLLHAADRRGGESPLDAWFVLTGRLDAVQEAAGDRTPVGLIGDSVLAAYPPGKKVPQRLQGELDRRAPGSVRVVDLSLFGLSPFDWYGLADRIGDSGLEDVVLAFNLDALNEDFARDNRRLAFLGGLPLSELGTLARSRLDHFGVSFHDAVRAMVLFRLGLPDVWRDWSHLQIRAGRAVETARGVRTEGDEDFAEDRRARAETLLRLRGGRYGPALRGVTPEHPMLVFLGEAIRLLRARGVAVTLVVLPFNHEAEKAFGTFDPVGFGQTMAALEEVARRSGATLVDLHDALPRGAFRDVSGHLTFEGEVDGSALFSAALADALLGEGVGVSSD